MSGNEFSSQNNRPAYWGLPDEILLQIYGCNAVEVDSQSQYRQYMATAADSRLRRIALDAWRQERGVQVRYRMSGKYYDRCDMIYSHTGSEVVNATKVRRLLIQVEREDGWGYGGAVHGVTKILREHEQLEELAVQMEDSADAYDQSCLFESAVCRANQAIVDGRSNGTRTMWTRQAYNSVCWLCEELEEAKKCNPRCPPSFLRIMFHKLTWTDEAVKTQEAGAQEIRYRHWITLAAHPPVHEHDSAEE